jgi:hypothetical protein
LTSSEQPWDVLFQVLPQVQRKRCLSSPFDLIGRELLAAHGIGPGLAVRGVELLRAFGSPLFHAEGLTPSPNSLCINPEPMLQRD